jgi:hypothetical protein
MTLPLTWVPQIQIYKRVSLLNIATYGNIKINGPGPSRRGFNFPLSLSLEVGR